MLLLEVPQRVFLVVSLQSHPIKAKLTIFFQESDPPQNGRLPCGFPSKPPQGNPQKRHAQIGNLFNFTDPAKTSRGGFRNNEAYFRG